MKNIIINYVDSNDNLKNVSAVLTDEGGLYITGSHNYEDYKLIVCFYNIGEYEEVSEQTNEINETNKRSR